MLQKYPISNLHFYQLNKQLQINNYFQVKSKLLFILNLAIIQQNKEN